MDFQSLRLAYSGRGAPFEGNALVLEQKDWSPYDGAITNTSMVNAIANWLYGSGGREIVGSSTSQVGSSTSQVGSSVLDDIIGASLGGTSSNFNGSNPTQVECSLDGDGCMTATIFAYPIPWDLNYTLRATHGRVSSRREYVQEFRELVQVRLQDPGIPISPDYPIKSLRDYEWFGNVYNNLGDVVPSPNITVRDTEIYIDARVYGTIDVTYTVEKHIYTIEVTPDFDRPVADQYKSVAYAPYDGGVEWEEIDPAPSTNLDFSSCGGWINVTVDSDDDLPWTEGNEKIDEYRYC